MVETRQSRRAHAQRRARGQVPARAGGTRPGRNGYSGVFRCALDVDAAFRRAEPPTHDDWIYRADPVGPRQNVRQGRARAHRGRMPRGSWLRRSSRAASERGRHPARRVRRCTRRADARCDGPGARRRASWWPCSDATKAAPSARPTLDSAESEVWVDGTTPDAQTAERPEGGEAATGRDLRLPGRDQPVPAAGAIGRRAATRDRFGRNPGDPVPVRAARTWQQIPPASGSWRS